MRIAEAAFDWGAEVAMTSPKHRSGTDRLAEVAAKASEFSHIINIQGDEPLIDPKLIDRLTRELQRDRKLEMITAAHPFSDPAEAQSPHQVKVVIGADKQALYFSRAAIPFPRDSAAHGHVFAPPGHLRLHARSAPALRPLETVAARARRVAGAIARLGEWSKNSRAAHEDRIARHRHTGRRGRAGANPRSSGTESASVMKYIFVTGGVVSSLGKGLAAAALGTLLELRGLRVVFQKFDPYLNVDPGTMNPFQHGEVYVLNDGAETDLDLGHYERFTNCVLSRHNNLTSGQVYESVILKERRGDYLGKTVQVIPHVTDQIKQRIREVAEESKADILITEIGGTTGDIEGLPFLEAIRQFILEVGPQNVINVHVTLVPYIKAAGELKTKPTQQSIAKLREIGLQPQVLMCRTELPLDAETRQKLSMFCNVSPQAVIEARDVQHTIYEVPLMLNEERLDELVCQLLHLETPAPDLTNWRKFVERIINPKKQVKIAVVGKYIDLQDAYKSIYESLTHAAASQDCGIDLKLIDAEALQDGVDGQLKDVAGVLIPGGFGERGVEGKIQATRFARENNVPYLGLCLGMQVATIEFARNVCGIADANSTEFDQDTPDPVISLAR